MIIGIDARELEGKRTGVGRYLEGLLSFWAKMDMEFVLFFKDEIPEIPVISSKNFKRVLVPFFLKREGWLWEQIALPLYSEKEGINVLFSPSYTAPFFGRFKKILTIHDLSYVKRPDWFSMKEGFRRRFFTKISIRRVERVITVSEFVKDEIMRKYILPHEKVDVIYHGVNPIFRVLNKEKEKFILSVGAIFQRRNIPLLLEALSFLEREDWKLKIVGENRTYPRIDIKEIVKKMRLNQNVEILGYVSDQELLELYNISSIFVSLSEYEGFGLPILEAMACGLPCVLFYGHSYKELFEGAAYFVKELSFKTVKDKIEELIEKEELRKELSEKGLNLARNFSLQTCAEKTIDCILKAI
ncbi:MAG: glycosyltransferase family 4 protein [Candidatus Aminicenantia bacterium]